MMLYKRAAYLGFLRGYSFDELDDECRMQSGFSQKTVLAYSKMLEEQPRTHYRHPSGAKWLCGSGKVTRNKDRVTCRRCLAYVDKLGGPVLGS